MEKLKMSTPNLADENFQKLAALFPNAVTEAITGYDENGKAIIERAIDADVLRQEISATVLEGTQERYQFTWPDKKKSVVLSNQPITKTLRLVREKSVGHDGTTGSIDTENIYIEGDNLDALKLLQETYLGKVKMIYIDPPYNTGNDFIYDDDFSRDEDEYLDDSGQFDEDGGRLVQNLESNGRFHTDWLNMIYPRLRIAKDLLSDDGVIFISIDDSEQANLKKVCDDIFGVENFVCNIIWQKKYSPQNDTKWLSDNHDFILVYAKLKYKWSPNLLPRTEEMNDRYRNPDNDPKGPWKSVTLHAKSGNNANFSYTFRNGVTWMPPSGTYPRFSLETLKQYDEEGKIWFGADGRSVPAVKNYLSEVKQGVTPLTLWTYDEVGHNQIAREDVKKCFDGKNVFDTPKPVSLIARILQIATDQDSIILDFFSGSATTAHAVMKLNAEDGGHRKFILVQLPEVTPEKSEARKAGYKTICEIGEERIRRAGKKILAEDEKWNDVPLNRLDGSKVGDYTPAKVVDIIFPKDGSGPIELIDERKFPDVGFRVFKVDSSNMEDVYYNPKDFKQGQMSLLADNIKPDRTPEDLLFQVMLDLGILLSSKIEETIIDGKKVFSVANGYLFACFDRDVTEETVKAIAKQQPFYAVFRDAGMASDSVITNFEQIFETYSPKTQRKVL